MRPGHYIKDLKRRDHKPAFGGLDILKYIGPGLLVTVGFIDPGNWASNIAAGSSFGYELLWMVTLSTIMLIILQHNVAHLGIATGLCLSEALTTFVSPRVSRSLLVTALGASVSTSLAEILGAALALNMLFDIPVAAGALMAYLFVLIILLSNTYRRIEKFIIAFVSIIGLSFLYELTLVDIDWFSAGIGWVKPVIPKGSLIIVMSVLGAVVMPHNLFLHSEVIQSRRWNLEEDKVIKRQLKYEFYDTLLSMIAGWAINSAMILLATTAFFSRDLQVTGLQQAEEILRPLLGSNASVVFAVALLCSGVASAITSGMAGGTITAGWFRESYDIQDNHSRLGVIGSLTLGFLLILLIRDAYHALIISQMILSIQLPFTIFPQIYLTSSATVMGKFVNRKSTTILLLIIGGVVTFLNIRLLISLIL
ncbi:MAG TPA: Nramp family divalent metal transporter [Bacteroidales bacterium]|nr:Nramp family divalent metal transporter [Bacteroidales bacterium]HPS74087.1 Nramp family divalent metal transporter [Bacteroidales bacterium]